MKLKITFALLFIITSCSFLNKYKNDRIFLDFHLGMTWDEFYSHISDLDDREDIDFWRPSIEKEIYGINESHYFRYRLFDNILATAYITPNLDYSEFNNFDSEDRLTSITLIIENYDLKTRSIISSSDKIKVANLFIEKYGKSQVANSKDLIWSFPSIEEPKYICRLDTARMFLTYNYNPLFLIPILDNQEKEEEQKAKERIKDAI